MEQCFPGNLKVNASVGSSLVLGRYFQRAVTTRLDHILPMRLMYFCSGVMPKQQTPLPSQQGLIFIFGNSLCLQSGFQVFHGGIQVFPQYFFQSEKQMCDLHAEILRSLEGISYLCLSGRHRLCGQDGFRHAFEGLFKTDLQVDLLVGNNLFDLLLALSGVFVLAVPGINEASLSVCTCLLYTSRCV